jgi:hypothetical protein
MRYKYHINGDMSEVFRTSVLRRNFHSLRYENEKFCPEALFGIELLMKYNLRCFSKVIYYRRLFGWRTDINSIVKVRMNSSKASMICYSELNSYDIPFMQKIKAAINYWRFRFCSNDADKPKISLFWGWTMPLGFIMHLNDKRNNC